MNYDQIKIAMKRNRMATLCAHARVLALMNHPNVDVSTNVCVCVSESSYMMNKSNKWTDTLDARSHTHFFSINNLFWCTTLLHVWFGHEFIFFLYSFSYVVVAIFNCDCHFIIILTKKYCALISRNYFRNRQTMTLYTGVGFSDEINSDAFCCQHMKYIH